MPAPQKEREEKKREREMRSTKMCRANGSTRGIEAREKGDGREGAIGGIVKRMGAVQEWTCRKRLSWRHLH